MVDRNTKYSRRHVPRRHVTKENDTMSNIDDNSESKLPFSYKTIFLMESTANGTKYIDIYKDALNQQRVDGRECHNTIVIDRDRLVRSVADDTCLEKNGTYRRLHEQAKRGLTERGRISTKLMAQLVHQSIIVALESRHRRSNDVVEKNTTSRFAAGVNVMLTNFFDLPFIVDFISACNNNIRVDAIIELSCGEIARVRDKFVSKACGRAERDNEIREFWQDFRAALDTERVASVFKDIVVYTYKSGYRADREPPDADRIVVASREHVLHEMDGLQRFVSQIWADYENFTKNGSPMIVYPLPIDDDHSHLYGSYCERLADYPEGAMTVPVILDAILKAIKVEPAERRDADAKGPWVDVSFDKLRDELSAAGEGCMNYPVCVPFGDERGVTIKKYDLRHTDYSASAVNALTVRWKRLLWGSHPLLPPNIVDEYNAIVSDVKSQCECRDDVDAQLCVLAVNRLRNNLEVFRGERIGLPTLGTTVVTYKPNLLEPLGCRTMVQVLEKKSEQYEGESYAYFEPEDVMLVGFYDFRPTRMRSSFDFTVPHQPVHVSDYFGLFHGPKGCKTDWFYAMDPPRWWWCPTYKEDTERIRFRDNDRLTVSKRKWRFEPGTVCLTYKSGSERHSYEIVRHVMIGGENDNDDNDRFKICTSAGDEYYIEIRIDRAGGGSIIEFTGRTASDGMCTEIVSMTGSSGSSTIRLSKVSGGDRLQWTAMEIGRRFEDGRVIVELPVAHQIADAVTYWANGKTGEVGSSENRTAGGTGDRGSTTSSRGTSATRRPTGSSRASSASQKKARSRISSRNLAVTAGPEKDYRKTIPEDDYYQHGTIKYSSDRMTRTVTFEDGTMISTRRSVTARNTSSRSATTIYDPGWTSSVVTGYEYAHPAYRTVTDDRSGMFTVGDLVTRTPDGCLRLQLSGAAVVIEINADAIHVRRGDDRGPKIATFGRKKSEFLFEKNVSATTTTVALDRTTAAVVVISAGSKNSSPPPPAEYFVVKRGMSGFGMLDGSWYERFDREMRDRSDAVVREDRNGIVTLFAADGGTGKKPTGDRRGYRWFQVPFGTKGTGIVTVPELLTFKAFAKVGIDYGPVLDALRSAGTQGTCDGSRPTNLDVRVNVPRDATTVYAIYAAGNTSRHNAGQDKRFIQTLLSRVVGLSVKCARRRQNDREALEARTRMRHNGFIPYFRCNIYSPLKDHLATIGLSYSP